jgi:hypothetical protein
MVVRMMRFIARLGNPLDWTPRGRCLFVSVLILPFVLWGAFVERYILATAPFVSSRVLALALNIQIGLAVAWSLMILMAFVIPSGARAGRTLMHATALLYFVTAAQGSYLTGFFTSLFSGVTFIAGIVVGLVLFDRGVVLPTVFLFLVFPLVTTIAELAGLIPYAPLMAGAPFADGRLSGRWLLGYGTTTFAAFVGVAGVIYFVIQRWGDRRSNSLARTSSSAVTSPHRSPSRSAWENTA